MGPLVKRPIENNRNQLRSAKTLALPIKSLESSKIN